MPDQDPVQRTPFPAEAERERANRPLSDRPEFEGREHVDPFKPDANDGRDGSSGATAAARESARGSSGRTVDERSGTAGLGKPASSTAEIATSREAGPTDATQPDVPLLSESDAAQLRDRWTEYQASFVDAPREAVQSADELVADVMQRVAKEFADRRSSLESRWARGEDVTTEDLRVALQGYREFFNRLLAA